MNTPTFSHRLFRLSLAAALLTFILPAQARYKSGWSGDNYHFIYLSGGAGYSMLASSNEKDIFQGNWGGLAGLGYEFRNSGFWTSVGAQWSLHQSGLQFTPDRTNVNGFNNGPVVLHYDVTQTDTYRWHAMDIPILAGYYKYGFYVGAGAKIGYFISPKSQSTGEYELSATHLPTNMEFHNMPNHGYTTYPFAYTHDAKLKPQIALIGEIGYDLLSSVPTRSTMCHILKLGFYFEYGLNNLITPTDVSSTVVPSAYDATNADILPYVNIAAAQGQRIVPYLTGLKLTYAFGGSRTARRGGLHHGCLCYQ